MKITGNIITPDKSFFGEVDFTDSIQNIKELDKIKVGSNFLLPGFIDLHVHGGGGADVMEGEEAIRVMLKTHAKSGTTSLLATTVTDKTEKLKSVFKDIAKVLKYPKEGEASLLGVHLEGPFLSSQKMGAQPDFARAFDLEEVISLHQIAPIKIITIAPESNISKEEISKLKSEGILIQIGHSNADYETSKEFIEKNASSVTHLFNAMSGFHHRAPGLVGACLAHANYAELIPDLLHVHPGAISMALRSIPELYFVTDATAACGMPDGTYKLGSNEVYKCGNGIRLKDGTLAGSSLTMDLAFKNIYGIIKNMQECSKRFSGIQANLLNLKNKGSLINGNIADIVVLDQNQNLREVYLAGAKI